MVVNYIALDFRLVVAASKIVEEWKKDLHKKLIRAIFTIDSDLNELGPNSTIALNSKDIQLSSKSKISEIFLTNVTIHNSFYACIIDFFNNEEYDRRSVILDDIISELIKVYKANKSKRFVIILPDRAFPDVNLSCFHQLLEIKNDIEQNIFELYIVIKDGTCAKLITTNIHNDVHFSLSLIRPSSKKNSITAIFNKINKMIFEEQLKYKCIRRMGHFQVKRAAKTIDYCKLYSYFFYDCDKEFKYLLLNLWKKKKINCDSIIYDSKSDISFKAAITSISIDNGIYCDRIDDILSSEDLAYIYKNKNSPILVVDVIDTGQTVEYYYEELRRRKIKVSNLIIAALDKSGVKSPREIKGLIIYSILPGNRIVEYNKKNCEQCSLKLPYTSEESEYYYKIRTYDFMKMIIDSGGFEKELINEKPKRAKRYKSIPKYSKILESHGPWIAYKINEYLKKNSVPADSFIIRPEESQSRQITSYIQRIRDMKPVVVEIPRDEIDRAGFSQTEWGKIINELKEYPWVLKLQELRKIGGNRAIIIDIFKSSGATCKSLKALLDFLDITCLGAYFLVDYRPDERYYSDINLMNYSLYQWYNPR